MSKARTSSNAVEKPPSGALTSQEDVDLAFMQDLFAEEEVEATPSDTRLLDHVPPPPPEVEQNLHNGPPPPSYTPAPPPPTDTPPPPTRLLRRDEWASMLPALQTSLDALDARMAHVIGPELKTPLRNAHRPAVQGALLKLLMQEKVPANLNGDALLVHLTQELPRLLETHAKALAQAAKDHVSDKTTRQNRAALRGNWLKELPGARYNQKVDDELIANGFDRGVCVGMSFLRSTRGDQTLTLPERDGGVESSRKGENVMSLSDIEKHWDVEPGTIFRLQAASERHREDEGGDGLMHPDVLEQEGVREVQVALEKVPKKSDAGKELWKLLKSCSTALEETGGRAVVVLYGEDGDGHAISVCVQEGEPVQVYDSESGDFTLQSEDEASAWLTGAHALESFWNRGHPGRPDVRGVQILAYPRAPETET